MIIYDTRRQILRLGKQGRDRVDSQAMENLYETLSNQGMRGCEVPDGEEKLI